jgi:hypothetical protein
MTGLVDRPAHVLYLVLMILGVVAVYEAVFRLWHPATAASTRRAWLLGATRIVVILLGAVVL